MMLMTDQIATSPAVSLLRREMKLYYWNVKARGQLPAVLLEVGKIPHEWNRNPDWPGMKERTPFGQLPFLEDGDIKVGQSMAIARYISRKAGLEGEGADFAISEMLIEEHNDLFTSLSKAQYHPSDKPGTWKTVLNEDIPKQFALLEKLLHGDHFGSKLTAGDVAIWSVINIILDLNPKALDNFHKLKAFYEHLSKNPGVANYLKNAPPAYFKVE